MRSFLKLSVTLLLLITLILMASLSVNAADEPDFPKEVNGLPVIFVETSENTVGLTEGQVTLVLLDNTSTTAKESLVKRDFEIFFKNKVAYLFIS